MRCTAAVDKAQPTTADMAATGDAAKASDVYADSATNGTADDAASADPSENRRSATSNGVKLPR